MDSQNIIKHTISSSKIPQPIFIIIEDDKGLNRLIQFKLKSLGYKSLGFFFGADAFPIISKYQNPILIVDYYLPDTTGKEIILKLHKEGHAKIPFMVMTGNGDENLAVEMMKLGAYDYLVKNPVLIDILPTVIQKVVARVETEKQLEIAQLALKEREHQYRSLFNSLLHGVVYRNKNKKVTSANPAAEKILGLTANQLKGKAPYPKNWETIREDGSNYPLEEQPAFKALETGKEEHSVMGVYNSEKEKFVWIDVYSIPQYRNGEKKPYQVYTVFEDITKRVEAEQQTIKERKILFTLMNHTPDFIYFKDTRSKFTNANKAMLHRFGRDKVEDLIGSTDFDFYDKEHAQSAFEDEQKILETKKPIINKIEKETWKRKEDSWVSTTKTPVFDDKGNVNGIMGISRDITEQKRFENEMHNYHQHLEKLVNKRTDELEKSKAMVLKALEREKELNKFHSKIVTTVSHDFRTPLAIIQSSIEILSMHQEKTPDTTDITFKHLNQITNSVQQLTNLLDDMLRISKVESGSQKFNPSEINLDEFCKKLISGLELATKYSHKIEYSIKAKSHKIVADQKILTYVLDNLLSNAIKYSPNADKIKFEVEILTDNVEFIITDYGIGIPKKEFDNLFTMFYRAENSKGIKGSGLGLSIVKSYVNLYGGQIAFKSAENKGSIFKVCLPLEKNYYKISNEINKSNKSINWNIKKILMVVDDPIKRKQWEDFLSITNAKIFRTTNGVKLIKKLKSNQPYDLILMEMELPDINGFEIVKQIRELDHKIPIVGYMAFARTVDKELGIKAGCKTLISNPVYQEKLLGVLSRYI